MNGKTVFMGMGVALLGLLAGTASSADLYVKAGATDDGSDYSRARAYPTRPLFALRLA